MRQRTASLRTDSLCCRAAPGTKAVKEIANLQKSTKNLIPKAPFARLVRGIGQNLQR